jgi:catechol 2,3-dioxygenase-like lactoylglutathione lyase family enzyme
MRSMSELTRRQLLLSLPALALARRAVGQPAPAIRIRSLNHVGLTVVDTKRSIEFYQGLFGMAIQQRNGASAILRVGSGPQFVSIAPVENSAKPAITHYCLGVEGFDQRRVLATLAAHRVTQAGAPPAM